MLTTSTSLLSGLISFSFLISFWRSESSTVINHDLFELAEKMRKNLWRNIIITGISVNIYCEELHLRSWNTGAEIHFHWLKSMKKDDKNCKAWDLAPSIIFSIMSIVKTDSFHSRFYSHFIPPCMSTLGLILIFPSSILPTLYLL